MLCYFSCCFISFWLSTILFVYSFRPSWCPGNLTWELNGLWSCWRTSGPGWRWGHIGLMMQCHIFKNVNWYFSSFFRIPLSRNTGRWGSSTYKHRINCLIAPTDLTGIRYGDPFWIHCERPHIYRFKVHWRSASIRGKDPSQCSRSCCRTQRSASLPGKQLIGQNPGFCGKWQAACQWWFINVTVP